MILDLIGILFILSLIIGVIVNFVGLPGNALISFNSLVYALVRNFDGISWKFLAMVFAIALLVEFVEFLAISFTSQKFGASKKAVWGAFFGGVLGALSGFFVTPVVGSLVGSVGGVIVGAILLEFYEKRDLRVALQAGLGAFLGKIGGVTVKVVGSVVLATFILYNLMG
jgi:uncharacterized protein YqgC (DUF456 family)